jgi:hypothetical protein
VPTGYLSSLEAPPLPPPGVDPEIAKRLGPASLAWLQTPQGQAYAQTGQRSQPKPATGGPSPLDILSALLGGQQAQVPKGYADFFTSVLGPLMAQVAGSFKAPPLNPADLAAMQPGDRAAVEKAYGQSVAGLQEMLAGQTLASTMMPGIQQFVEGPLANYQKLAQQLINALSFVPYSAQGIARLPVEAGSVLEALGINPAASAGTLPTTGTAPQLTVP